MKTWTFEIRGMTCGHCVHSVKTALLAIPGVTKADVDLGRAGVTAHDDVPRDAIAKAITDEGYELA